jgi:hypothetical protein
MTDAGARGTQPFATEKGRAHGHLPEGPKDPRWRLIDRLVVVAFMVTLLVPAGLLAAGKRPPRLENRPLLNVPAFSLDRALDATWPTGVDAYLADNMALRGFAIRIRGELEYRTGGSGNPNVIPGLDGWVFPRGAFEPDCRFTADEIARAVTDAAERFRSTGQAFRFVLVPDKHVIYPERVRPDLAFPPACNETGRPVLQDMLADQAPATIDGITLLLREKADRPDGPALFYSMDTHWTPSGAILAIRALIQSIDPALWSEDDVVVDGTFKRTMDLARQLGIRRIEETPKLVVRPSVKTDREDLEIPIDVGNARAVFHITASGDRPLIAGRTVVVYDSAFGNSIPLVAPFFEDATWVHVGDLVNHPELAELLGPFDTVIVDRVERGLYATDLARALGALADAAAAAAWRGPRDDMAAWAARQAVAGG